MRVKSYLLWFIKITRNGVKCYRKEGKDGGYWSQDLGISQDEQKLQFFYSIFGLSVKKFYICRSVN